MKMKSLFAFASVAMALTACSNNEDAFVNSNFPEDGVIRVATNVDAPATRSGMDNDNLTSFYMDVQNENSTAYSYFVQMKKKAVHGTVTMEQTQSKCCGRTTQLLLR